MDTFIDVDEVKVEETALTPSAGKHGGPRTDIGKERSRLNALKHGIFSKLVLVKGESKSQFDALLQGLRHDFQPVGTMEEILVEKLATILFRYRRFLQAENGEVMQNIHWLEAKRIERSERAEDSKNEREVRRGLWDPVGLISDIDKPGCVEKCIDWLGAVKEDLEATGFEGDFLWPILGRVYGARQKDVHKNDHLDLCINCFKAYRASDEDRKKRGFESKEDCIHKCIDATEKEIRRLEGFPRFPKRPTAAQLELRRRESYQCVVPGVDALDRLLRYEASLDRAFDRTLNQLQRIQLLRGARVVPCTENDKG